ncbi:MAG TPA: hypothetical protein VGD98_01240 [Ktedonobacteraceae bacterium]
MGKQTNNKPFRQEDYNEATEPLPLLPYVNPYSAGNAAVPTQPATQPIFLPYVPPAQPTYAQPQTPAYPQPQPPAANYPVLPPLKKQRGRPPGGAEPYEQPLPARRRRRNRLPGLVRFFFVLVELVLLARIVCMLFRVQASAFWFALLVAASDLFVQPAHWLATYVNISWLAGTSLLTYLEFVVAILMYAIISRLLSFLLRVL